MLRCSTCTARFSARKGSPRLDARLPADTVVSVLAHVADGVGTRKTARRVGVSRYLRRAGGHARDLHDERVAFSPDNQRRPVR